MDLKNKIKNYGFWMSLTGAVILVLQTIGKIVGFSIDSVAIESVVSSICGVLIILGIINNPTKGKWYVDGTTKEENTQEEKKEDSVNCQENNKNASTDEKNNN